MSTDSSPDLNQLATDWSLVYQAHSGTAEQAASAQVDLMGCYAAAVHRFLVGVLGDRTAADELDQEFAVRFLRGDFHRANPAEGRFRDFVKRALRNLVIDYQRRRSTRPRPLGDRLPEPVDTLTADKDFDQRFIASWRSELISRALDELQQFQERTGQPYYTVLKLRTKYPELNSSALAARLSAELCRTISPGGLRMLLQRSRGRFVGFLLDEVTQTQASPTVDQLEEELGDLGLLEYCRQHLKRRGHQS